ncbi:MAG TPA: 50S ribosomal protein L5 [Candidatus Brocadiia bacterium]|nr:50S ribosomal protein L5 [Candidatus Brocadiia bacterium]
MSAPGKEPAKEKKDKKELKDAKADPAPKAAPAEKAPIPRMLVKYRTEVLPQMMKEMGYRNALAAPRLDKIVVSMGVGKATENKKRLEDATKDLSRITGQKPLVCKAKRAVSAFRVRVGQEVGLKVTLRGVRMYEFLDRLISLVFPRIRDFRGLSDTAFDGRGNYSVGLTEQGVFPEIDQNALEFNQGMNIAFCIKNGTDEASREFLRRMGMPIRKPETGRKAG